MDFCERAVSFPCDGALLVGVASIPADPCRRGIVILPGGPQYRTGSHRQFVLLARALASDGIASLRFDYRGMGDSEGEMRGFEQVNDDLHSAVDALMASCPALDQAAIWGLCDAASAAMCYARHDVRVSGLVLLNPWVRTDAGLAAATLRHYYGARLLQAGLWKRILAGRFHYRAAARSLAGTVATAFRRTPAFAGALPQRMLDGFTRFRGRALFIFSGADLTAREFIRMADGSLAWRRAFKDKRAERHTLAAADHTFSRRAWRDQVALWTSQWVRSW